MNIARYGFENHRAFNVQFEEWGYFTFKCILRYNLFIHIPIRCSLENYPNTDLSLYGCLLKAVCYCMPSMCVYVKANNKYAINFCAVWRQVLKLHYCTQLLLLLMVFSSMSLLWQKVMKQNVLVQGVILKESFSRSIWYHTIFLLGYIILHQYIFNFL